MNRTVKWIVALIVGAGAVVGLSFAFLEGRDEIARERERSAHQGSSTDLAHG